MYQLVRAINKFFKTGMYDYCNLEANDVHDMDSSTFVLKDGGLCTYFIINGTPQTIGKTRFLEKMSQCYENLEGVLKKEGHRVEFSFTRNPAMSRRVIEEMVNPMKQTAKDCSLEFESLLDERIEVMSKKTVHERGYLVVTTLPSAMNPVIHKSEVAQRSKSTENFKIPFRPGEFGQSPFSALSGLRQIHVGFVDAVVNAISDISSLKRLTCHQAMYSLRMEIEGGAVHKDWMPNLLGDKIPLRLLSDSLKKTDSSHLMNPEIAFQLFNFQPSINREDPTMVTTIDKIVAPLVVDIPPHTVTEFSDLFGKINADIPWRWNLAVNTGHSSIQSKVSTKNSFATFLAFFSSDNKLIKDAATEILDLVRSNNEVLVSCSMSICTWGDTVEEAGKRKQIVSQALTGWGSAVVIDESGDSVEAWVSTIPGISAKKLGTEFPIFLGDIIASWPLTRPASPWEKGTAILRTVDSKVFPYLPGSSLQTNWFDIFFAPPGFGKSFFLAALNMSLILSPGYKSLPKITIIDIGYSSAAFVDLIRSSLPENMQHLAKAFKIEMNKEYCVNMFDTPLGCQYPLAMDKVLLNNLLTLLLTPAGLEGVGVPRLPELVSKIIDETYYYFSEEKMPRAYEREADTVVDRCLDDLGFVPKDDTSWWEIVRFLKDNSCFVEAGLANRIAVPTISDITTVISQSSNIKDLYKLATYNDEPLIQFVESMLGSVSGDYPVLCSASRFDLGSARICSIDLSSVAKGGSLSGNKQAGVMYMLARLLCKEFYRDEDSLKEVPREYMDYHRAIFEENSKVPKKLCMDEFHRTRHTPIVRSQATIDAREGRKYNVHVALLSQLIDDFDDEMIEIVNNVFILSKGNSEDTINKIIKKFNPNIDSIKALRSYVKGPGKEGSSMLMLSRIKGATDVEMVCRLTLGPIEIWAYSTTFSDVRLRKRLSLRVGLNRALKMLAAEFPSGSAVDYIASRAANQKSIDDVGDDVLDVICTEMMARYHYL